MTAKTIKVGRANDNDIVLSDVSVSRYHCEFFFDSEGNVFLTDKNSSNGTFVNGRKILGSAKLESNDVVKAGLAPPLRWKEYNAMEQAQNIDYNNNKQGNISDSSNQQPSAHVKPRKRNKAFLTILITFFILVLFVGVGYAVNEYSASTDEPEIVDSNKPNDKTNQPTKIDKKKEITYDFSCLKDDNDKGTTDIIDVLEGIDKEVTNAFGGEVTIQEEEKVGNSLLADCRRQYKFLESGEKIDNLQSILSLLTAQIPKPKGFNYQIFLLESDELNAFTAGAKIFVTTKMYAFCQTNDELACVIGHEINHNELGHIKEHLQKEQMITAVGAALAQIITISFGQKKETHCDMTGIDLAIAAGYNGCVNIKLWKRMQKVSEEGEYNALENLFRSHPYSEKRAKCSHDHILNNYGFDCPIDDK